MDGENSQISSEKGHGYFLPKIELKKDVMDINFMVSNCYRRGRSRMGCYSAGCYSAATRIKIPARRADLPIDREISGADHV